jgi:hypothetical protein
MRASEFLHALASSASGRARRIGEKVDGGDQRDQLASDTWLSNACIASARDAGICYRPVGTLITSDEGASH